VISLGVPIKKAKEDETLIGFALNAEEIQIVHSYPLRLIVNFG